MFRWLAASIVAALFAMVMPANSAGPDIPQFWDVKERITEPDLSRFARIRFLTTVDFPPFNFIDSNGLISGCYPLDEFYKERPEHELLLAAKGKAAG